MALVKYNGKNVLGVSLKTGLVRIMPGVNEVGDHDLTLMKAHPLLKARIDKGLVQILQDAPSKDGKRSVEEMLQLMPNIFDIKLLKKLIDTDGRAPVVKAAQQQLDAIKNPSKAKAEAEDESHFK
jgi:hypothetical protein